MRNMLFALTGCLFILSGSAACGEPTNPFGPAGTGEYVFLADQSTILQTGGFAGVHWTYHIEGRFCLTVNIDAGTASFRRVEAKATDDSPYQRTLDPNEVFNLTGLGGTVVDETTIRLEGKADDGSNVVITLTFADGTVALKGQTTPPPNSADFFVFTLDAVAQCQCACGMGELNYPCLVKTAQQFVFCADQSSILQTGGIAGVHWTYHVVGQFRVRVNADDQTASFERVDAIATDGSAHERTLDPNEVFNLTALAGTVAEDGKLIRFEGNAHDGSSVVITLTFADGTVALKGETTPPPNSADFFVFTLDTVAQPQCTCGPDDSCLTKATQQFAFIDANSTILQTGGFAGVHWTYHIEGRFCLTVNIDAGTASFARVEANAVDDSPSKRTLDPNDVFNMIGLAGTVADDGKSIRFEGTTGDGSSVVIVLTFADSTVTLKGQTTPPPHSADFFIFALDAVAQRKYAGGTGEPNDPYLIGTVEQLASIGTEADMFDKCFLLMNDLDLDPNLPGGCIFDRAVIGGFAGSFDGGGYTIRNLVIDSNESESLGLFGYVGWEGQIRRLSLENVRVYGEGFGTGTLAGTNDGLVEDCHASGRVTGRDYVGGLVGDALGTIRACSAQVAVAGDKGYCYTGGLVGWNCGLIVDCCAAGEVSAPEDSSGVGGLVGVMGYPGDVDMGGERTITRCSAGGRVSAGDGSRQLGGLVGLCAEGTITNCYATGEVVGGARCSYLGGLVGQNGMLAEWADIRTGIISDCYATGCVSSGQDSQGLGGLVGWNRFGDVNHSFWDTETSHQATSDGGEGKATEQMRKASTFLEAGWDFVGEAANGTEDVWWILEGQDYPRLSWERLQGDDFGDGELHRCGCRMSPGPSESE